MNSLCTKTCTCSKQVALAQAIQALAIAKGLAPFDRDVLTRYPGSGVLKEAGIFSSSHSKWVVPLREKLKGIVTKQEWASLQNSGMLNSHYTSSAIRSEMWRHVLQYMPTDPLVLDPGCGIGSFRESAPTDIRYVGVENCPIVASIAKLAHRDSDIYCRDFLDWQYPLQFDLVIGNVPFVGGLSSMTFGDKRCALGLHAQFIGKSVKHLKPGGVLAVLTSVSTLDSVGVNSVAFREWLHQQCELLNAIRLPAALVHLGATKVTTDLLILRKRPSPIDSKSDWSETENFGIADYSGTPIRVNKWFVRNSSSLIGIPSLNQCRGKNGQLASTLALVLPEGLDVASALREKLHTPHTTIENIMATSIAQECFKSSSVYSFILRENPKKRGIEIHLHPNCDMALENTVGFVARMMAAGYERARSNDRLFYTKFSEQALSKARSWVKSCASFGAYEMTDDDASVEERPSRRYRPKPAATETPFSTSTIPSTPATNSMDIDDKLTNMRSEIIARIDRKVTESDVYQKLDKAYTKNASDWKNRFAQLISELEREKDLVDKVIGQRDSINEEYQKFQIDTDLQIKELVSDCDRLESELKQCLNVASQMSEQVEAMAKEGEKFRDDGNKIVAELIAERDRLKLENESLRTSAASSVPPETNMQDTPVFDEDEPETLDAPVFSDDETEPDVCASVGTEAAPICASGELDEAGFDLDSLGE